MLSQEREDYLFKVLEEIRVKSFEAACFIEELKTRGCLTGDLKREELRKYIDDENSIIHEKIRSHKEKVDEKIDNQSKFLKGMFAVSILAGMALAYLGANFKI